jgi:hypothetical protein
MIREAHHEPVDHLRRVGIRGFVAEHTHDEDFVTAPGHRWAADETASAGTMHEAARADIADGTTPPASRRNTKRG